MRNFLLGIVSVISLLIVAGGAYYFGFQKSATNNAQEVSITPTEAEKTPSITTPSTTPTTKPEINVSEQIIAAIKSKNTQALEGYMTSIVQVRLESSGCCGSISKTEAINQLAYLNQAVGWSFDPTNPILVNIAAKAPNYYGNGWIVGVASNEYVISFKLNDQNKIEAYNMASSYKLLFP
ncbi:hypothetical protein KKG52_03300 [Patescibacteria group bacterium]|nr:hypothetical protein [Patescibacteria group bacterium]